MANALGVAYFPFNIHFKSQSLSNPTSIKSQTLYPIHGILKDLCGEVKYIAKYWVLLRNKPLEFGAYRPIRDKQLYSVTNTSRLPAQMVRSMVTEKEVILFIGGVYQLGLWEFDGMVMER